MNFSLSLDLLLYGLMLIGLSLVVHRITPDFAGVTLTLLVAGGLFIVFWGVLGLRGFRRRTWPIVTLTIVAALLLVEAAKAWFALKSGIGGMKPVAVIFSLLLFFAIGQLVNFAQSGRNLRTKFRDDTDNPTNGKGQRQQRPPPPLDE